jgi:hypothetical protein
MELTRRRSEQRKAVPAGKPFAKGKSGNPGGRPKIPEDVKEACRALTPMAISTLQEVCASGETPPGVRVAAAEAILNRAWGRPVQEIVGKDGEALVPDHDPIRAAKAIALLLTMGTLAVQSPGAAA